MFLAQRVLISALVLVCANNGGAAFGRLIECEPDLSVSWGHLVDIVFTY